jgi:hypothetical protein
MLVPRPGPLQQLTALGGLVVACASWWDLGREMWLWMFRLGDRGDCDLGKQGKVGCAVC